MAQFQTRPARGLDKVDPVWARIRNEAEDIAHREPELATFIYENILHHDTLEAAIAHRVSQRLDHADVSADMIRQAYDDALEAQPALGETFRADIVATVDRDPATIVRSASEVAPELLTLAQRCARVTLDGLGDPAPALRVGSNAKSPIHDLHSAATLDATEELRAFNGFGGFSADGSEYVIRLDHVDGRLRLPPRPWTNVVANETAGFIASETGAGYTWTVNSRENRLTPWSNDPVLDPPGETLYLRDEDRDLCWSPTPGPLPDGGAYECRHGFGYTIWRHASLDLEQETTAFVPRRDGVKLVRLRVTNRGPTARRLSVSFYARWVLGTTPEQDGRFVVTQYDPDTGAILAVHPYRGPLAGRVAFACVVGPEGRSIAASHTADRAAFLAAEGSGAPLDGSRNPRFRATARGRPVPVTTSGKSKTRTQLTCPAQQLACRPPV